MRFENIPVDGSVRLDNKITESLEPYDLQAAIPFQSAILAGAMADHADVDCDQCENVPWNAWNAALMRSCAIP